MSAASPAGGRHVPPWQLRARFARGVSALYAGEVPAYGTLVEACNEINAATLSSVGGAAERLGNLGRVTAERHGAIRVGTPAELAQVRRIFAAVGMYPVGFYDLRDAPSPVPVVSTAFRPIAPAELDWNPFRIFTSLLAVDDHRFFDTDLQHDINSYLGRRELFAPRLLTLADQSVADNGLDEAAAAEFLDLAINAFALSKDPIDRFWYDRLAKVSAVAADIAGVPSTHLNHLTPRVLDIDALYAAMTARGVTMINEIQGPPRWNGPPVLLRQTSFRALDEPRTFREPDGRLGTGSLRVRFGEVEARGLALTPTGRDRYEALMSRAQADPGSAASVFAAGLPATEAGFATEQLAFFTFRRAAARTDRPSVKPGVPTDLMSLVGQGFVEADPIVYEDFLPRSAAGIFASNLTDSAAMNDLQRAPSYDAEWLSGAMGSELFDPMSLYATLQSESVLAVATEFDLEVVEPG